MHVIFCPLETEQHSEALADAHGWELGQFENDWQEILLDKKKAQKKVKNNNKTSIFVFWYFAMHIFWLLFDSEWWTEFARKSMNW